VAKASDNVFPKVEMAEGSAPATPGANKVRLYAKSDGLLYSKDDTGAESLVSGGAGGGFTFSGASVTKSAQTINDSSLTKITFDTEDYDTSSYHDTGSNTDRLTTPANGKYRVGVTGYWSGNANGNERTVLIQVDTGSGAASAIAGESRAPGSINHWVSLVVEKSFTSGQYLTVQVYQDRGGTLDFNNAIFFIQRLDP